MTKLAKVWMAVGMAGVLWWLAAGVALAQGGGTVGPPAGPPIAQAEAIIQKALRIAVGLLTASLAIPFAIGFAKTGWAGSNSNRRMEGIVGSGVAALAMAALGAVIVFWDALVAYF